MNDYCLTTHTHTHTHTHTYIYIYVCVCVCVCVHKRTDKVIAPVLFLKMYDTYKEHKRSVK